MWKQCCLLVLIQCVLLSAVAVDEEPPRKLGFPLSWKDCIYILLIENIAEDVQVEQLRDDTEDVQEEEYMSKMLSADTQENDDEKSEVAQDGYLTQSDDDNGELEELGEAETDEDSNDEAASQGCSRVYRCRNG